MSEYNVLSTIANILRPANTDIIKGKGKLCLSINYLMKLNRAFNDYSPEELLGTVFNQSQLKLTSDLKFLLDLCKFTLILKITPELVTEDKNDEFIDIKRFENLKQLHLIHISNLNNRLIGLQKLRSKLEQLSCSYVKIEPEQLLINCGADNSGPFNWSELKYLKLTNCNLESIDTNLFNYVPCLENLDLSFNRLKEVQLIDCLNNLKILNLSFNELTKVPKCCGPIYRHLQYLFLNNNFIEDLTDLVTLSHTLVLNLSNNLLTNHNDLAAISYLKNLNSLNLNGNPLSFHRKHRQLCCYGLNKNILSLDNVPLTKFEKSLIRLNGNEFININNSHQTLSSLDNNSINEQQRRTSKIRRNVIIIEKNDVQNNETNNTDIKPIKSPSTKNDDNYLKVKEKIEQLRKERKDHWLSHDSGVIVQEFLNFPSSYSTSINNISPPLASSSLATNEDEEIAHLVNNNNNPKVLLEINNKSQQEMDNNNKIINNVSDGEDNEIVEGEIFYAGITPNEQDNLCIVITDFHLCERNAATTQEIARWGLNVVKSINSNVEKNEITIEFNCLRRDRSARTYYVKDYQQFLDKLNAGWMRNKIPEPQYECLKCNVKFTLSETIKHDENVLCKNCESSHVILK